MKRDDFEDMVQQALNRLAGDLIDKATTAKEKARVEGIGCPTYSDADRKAAQSVARLAACGRKIKPITIPSLDMVPPCF